MLGLIPLQEFESLSLRHDIKPVWNSIWALFFHQKRNGGKSKNVLKTFKERVRYSNLKNRIFALSHIKAHALACGNPPRVGAPLMKSPRIGRSPKASGSGAKRRSGSRSAEPKILEENFRKAKPPTIVVFHGFHGFHNRPSDGMY